MLYSFQGKPSDGANPYAGLIMDKTGNLYSTTVKGGAKHAGTVLKLAPDGTETELYSFCSKACTDGQYPTAGLIMDKTSSLYSTTLYGGAEDEGTVFKLAPHGTETVLYSFCSMANCTDGRLPYAGLIMDKTGNLYSTTLYGGAEDEGTVFKLAPDGTETVLYSFCSMANCTDGEHPHAGLIMDKTGNLYSTTLYGGADNNGTVFELKK